MSANEMESKVNELRELRRMADELAGEITALEDDLKAHMTATGSDELHGPSFKITWKEVTSSRLDGKALKAAAPELWQRFSKQTTSRRFVLA
jgi:predicted phage-related endonuclease